jgi:hypothetical protein
MALSEDLSAFLNDFGVSVTAGSTTGIGLLDMPGMEVLGGMVVVTDYSLTVRTSEFGSLQFNDAITVAGVSYQVREGRQLDDGAFTELLLIKA